MNAALLRRLLVAIAALTVASGLGQLLAPGLVLRVVGGEATPTSAHFFAIVGMFMVLFGGALWQALRSDEPDRIVLFWAGLQKLGAAVAVGVGVMRGIFSLVAIGVAGFDLLSGILIFAYWSGARVVDRART